MNDASGAHALPIFDISLLDGTSQERAGVVSRLREVIHQHGFFYLTGHGVNPDVIAETLEACRHFFALPEADKMAIAMVKSPHFRGYNRAGLELTCGKPDWREQLDIDTEEPVMALRPESPPWHRTVGPNQWPDAFPELRAILLRYQAEVTRVGLNVLRAIATALGQREDVLTAACEPRPRQHMKVIRYPGRDTVESSQGVGAHKDGGLVTVLLQDTVAGLRVRTEDGTWIDAPPLPGTFVINTGELLELATNGYVRADVHEVVVPPKGVERYSIAFFLGASHSATVPIIDLPDDLKRSERGVSTDPLNPILSEVGPNHLKARLRSHPDVARVHYVDLL